MSESTVAAATVERAALNNLRATLKGDVITRADTGYEEHRRVWNGSIDRRPQLIALCRDVADVQATVRFAAGHGLLSAVRGGGHSFPGLSTCDGGMVIDLGLMKEIRVDPESGTVRAQGGVLLGELDRATQAFGLAVPAGIVSHTGIAGLTLGGGTGWIQRKYGLTIDNLRSIELVTADGQLIRASDTENSDLFWGVRGGGGNFGIVTEFEFRLNRLGPQVMAGSVFWPASDAPRVLRLYRDWVANSPDELMTIVTQRRPSAMPGVPRELVGKSVLGIAICYAGPVEDGEKVLRHLKSFGSPMLDLCMPKPYLAHQASFDPFFEPGWWYYVRSCDVAGLNDTIIDIVSGYGERIGSPLTSLALWQMGGAVSRVGKDETAFNNRTAGFTFNINGNSFSAEGFEAEREWARSYWSALAPFHTSVYVNFLMEEGEDRIRQAYGAEKLNRLKALKRKYDPTNFFRLNQNIAP
jgi:FAD/FMN-containing dehydrogenase